MIRICSFPETDTPPDLRSQVLALQQEAWPGPAPIGGQAVHDQILRPLSMLVVEDRTVLAALDILFKELDHAGHRYDAGGLSTVVTRHEVRGRGHGHRLVTAAREVMAASGLDLGLFTCDRPLQRFYERAGWSVLPGTVLVGGTRDSPFPSDRPGFHKVTMAAFFSPRARSRRATFVDARIELYPGEIDKLW